MKHARTLALALLVAVAISLPLTGKSLPRPPQALRPVDLAICLDTSGSMSGLIESAKQKLWTVVNELAQARPTPRLRVALYRLVGFKIGRKVFIGMKCYLDDVDPGLITIEDNATVSYGTYFAVHGLDQKHTPIHIKENAYIGMRCTIVSGKNGITIGRNAVIGAGSLVNQSVPDNAVAVGCPIRITGTRDAESRGDTEDKRL